MKREEFVKTEDAKQQELLEKMKKEEKFSIWRSLKEAWRDKRYRSVMLLSFWLVFLFVIVGGVRVTSTKRPVIKPTEVKVKNAVDAYSKLTNYEFQTTLQMQESNGLLQNRVLIGSRTDFKEKFSNETDKTNYYLDNGVLYKKGELRYDATNDEFIELTLKPDILGKLLKTGTLEATTNFKDGSMKKEYSVSMKEFMSIYRNASFKGTETITITTLEMNQVIYEVECDLQNYMNQEKEQYQVFKLKIEYSNMNAVAAIEME